MNRLWHGLFASLVILLGVVSLESRAEDENEESAEHGQSEPQKKPTEEQMIQFLKCNPGLKAIWDKSAPIAREQKECADKVQKALQAAKPVGGKYAIALPTCYNHVLVREDHILINFILTGEYYKAWPADPKKKEPFYNENTFSLMMEPAEKDRYAADLARRIKLDAEKDTQSARWAKEAWGCELPTASPKK